MINATTEYEVAVREERGFLVDFGGLWSGVLSADDKTLVTGYRVFTKKGKFSGLLSEDKVILWDVGAITLRPEGKELLPIDMRKEDETEDDWLLDTYASRYITFTYGAIETAEVLTLDECPSILAGCHTLGRMQELMPAILLTEEKADRVRNLWAGCNVGDNFCYCCGKPIISGFRKESHQMFLEILQTIVEGIPWAEAAVQR